MFKFVFLSSGLFPFIKEIISKKFLIIELTKRDFYSKYINSLFGMAWAFLEPMFFVLILWLVFGFGLKSGIDISYLVTGIIPFNIFRTTLIEGTGSIRSYSFLVKKVDFKLSILAIIKLLSGLMLFALLYIIIFTVLTIKGIYPSLYWLQLFYYTGAMCFFLLGLIWLTSAIELFIPDIKNVIGIVMQFLFYLTPIFWKTDNLPPTFRYIAKFNPMFYLINGFRETFIYHKWFWESPYELLYFSGVSLFFLFTGIYVFKKLRPHFADVI